MCQILHVRRLWSDYCIKIHAPIAGEGIPGKKNNNNKKKQKKNKNHQSQRLYYRDVCFQDQWT